MDTNFFPSIIPAHFSSSVNNNASLAQPQDLESKIQQLMNENQLLQQANQTLTQQNFELRKTSGLPKERRFTFLSVDDKFLSLPLRMLNNVGITDNTVTQTRSMKVSFVYETQATFRILEKYSQYRRYGTLPQDGNKKVALLQLAMEISDRDLTKALTEALKEEINLQNADQFSDETLYPFEITEYSKAVKEKKVNKNPEFFNTFFERTSFICKNSNAHKLNRAMELKFSDATAKEFYTTLEMSIVNYPPLGITANSIQSYCGYKSFICNQLYQSLPGNYIVQLDGIQYQSSRLFPAPEDSYHKAPTYSFLGFFMLLKNVHTNTINEDVKKDIENYIQLVAIEKMLDYSS